MPDIHSMVCVSVCVCVCVCVCEREKEREKEKEREREREVFPVSSGQLHSPSGAAAPNDGSFNEY